MTAVTNATYEKLAVYRSESVGTAGPAHLVMMLYDGVLSAIAKAEKALLEGDLSGGHDELMRSQRIVSELAASLDVDRGGDVALSMASLYDFCQRGLIDANIQKSAGPLQPVVKVITELREAWAGAMAGIAA